MADYWTNVSFVVNELPAEAVQWLLGLDEEFSGQDGDEEFELPANSEYMSEVQSYRDECLMGYGVSITKEGPDLWFHTDESFEVSYAAWLIERTLKKFDLDAAIGFEWSGDCSKPRVDAFGGGAVIITKDGQEYVNTGSWLAEKLSAHKRKDDAGRSQLADDIECVLQLARDELEMIAQDDKNDTDSKADYDKSLAAYERAEPVIESMADAINRSRQQKKEQQDEVE